MDLFFLWYLLIGAVVGFLAGLLGIGGGLVQVPILVFLFKAQQIPPEHVLHLALGTAMASILFTSASSLRAHHTHDAVNWDIVKRMVPGVIFGVAMATFIASRAPTRYLAIFFTAFVYFAATQLILNIRPSAHRSLPGPVGMFAAGAVVGGISTLVAAGGALLSVPYMTWCNVRMHEAIGTAAAIGFPIAITGSIGYIVGGWEAPGLPSGSLGYIYVSALVWVVLASMLTAPAGARVAHRTPTGRLRKIFAVLLYILATSMLWNLL